MQIEMATNTSTVIAAATSIVGLASPRTGAPGGSDGCGGGCAGGDAGGSGNGGDAGGEGGGEGGGAVRRAAP